MTDGAGRALAIEAKKTVPPGGFITLPPKRIIWIGRITIDADLTMKTSFLRLLHDAVVAALAYRNQRTKPESALVVSMWRIMVRDLGRLYFASLSTEGA